MLAFRQLRIPAVAERHINQPRADDAMALMQVERQRFGRLQDGREVEAVLLDNGRGVRLRVINLGASLQSLQVPDRHGVSAEIILGYDTAEAYLTDPFYVGATIGRCANRIAGGRFELDGKHYQLECNSGSNHLHGGRVGFDKRIWQTVSTRATPRLAEVRMRHLSEDGDQGYPGRVEAEASFMLTEDDTLQIRYSARTDRPTLVNLTQHAYFNLASDGDILDHLLQVEAVRFTPVDEQMIPTGVLQSVVGSAMDFHQAHRIGARIEDSDPQLRLANGYDHNYVIDGPAGELRPAARLTDPRSGRVMDMWTSAAGLQVYTGNYLDGRIEGRNGVALRSRSGLCLEAQAFPYKQNCADFASPVLRVGETYRNEIRLRFGQAS